MGKVKKKRDEDEKRAFVLSQDLRLVRALAGNNSKVRDKVLRNLRKWFEQRSTRLPLTEQDFVRVWKGLFYTMWMSDKPLVQEECAEKIAALVHQSDSKQSLLFFKCGMHVLTVEWFGIDQLRLDKFLMLVRRILRQGLEVLRRNDWEDALIENFNTALLETVLQQDTSTFLGLTMHVVEIFLEELSKVSKGRIDKHSVALLLTPFIKYFSLLTDQHQINHLQRYFFDYLLYQSDEGIEYQVKYEAWKQRGFPGDTIDTVQLVENVNGDEELNGEDDDDLPEGKPLDPRAGLVDVALPQLPFDPKEISQLLLQHKFAEGSTVRVKKVMTKLAHDFEKLSIGIFPLGMKEVRMPEYDGYSTKLKKSVNRLVKLDKQLLADSHKNRRRKQKNKHKEQPPDGNFGSLADAFADKLQQFVKRSEGGLQKKQVLKRKREENCEPEGDQTDWSFEDCFRRNSGTWVVHKLDCKQSNDSFVCESTKQNGMDSDLAEGKDKASTHEVFPQNEWDSPLKKGETEIFIPSNKFKHKMKKLADKTGQDMNNLMNNSIQSLYKRCSLNIESNIGSINGNAKKRLSLDDNLVRNPFAWNKNTPKGEKRVKIDLNLNRSQDIHEHQAQLKSSPAIPYDANKRPLKPLLKANAVSSPINPFYRKKLKMW